MHLTTLTSQFMLLALSVLLFVTTSVLAVPALAEDLQVVRGQILPPGYKYEPLRMTGTIGDITLNHIGAIEEILAKVVGENPGFKIQDLASTSTTVAGGHAIARRDKETNSDLACYPFPGQPDWRAAEVRYINDGIAYLKKVNALCWTPNQMGLSCTYMASYVQDTLNRCAYSVGLMRLVGGQAWDTDGYNVNIMRDTSCQGLVHYHFISH
ncbi:hypothetical protein IFR05_014790 [Cadophora sp. M221]|nr:hypothetical protein IFR05_014790 [Cadophora sp. M221]